MMLLTCVAIAGSFYFAVPDADPQRLIAISPEGGYVLENDSVLVSDPDTLETWRLLVPEKDRGKPLHAILAACTQSA